MNEEKPLSFSEAFRAAAERSGLGQVAPGETPSAASLLAAVGGIRGLIESILPGFAFLLIYTITGELVPSVLAPVAIAVGFVIVRLVTRSPAMPAIAGLIGIGVCAALALFTGRAVDNFLPGLIINVVSAVAILISIVFRYPFVGIIVGFLTGEQFAWRKDPAKYRVVLIASWCWFGLFAARLAVQTPLFLSEAAEALASTKLIMGVPLYACMLWVTWLLVRSAFTRPSGQDGAGSASE